MVTKKRDLKEDFDTFYQYRYIAFIDGNSDSNDYVAKDFDEAHGDEMEEITW